MRWMQPAGRDCPTGALGLGLAACCCSPKLRTSSCVKTKMCHQ